MRRLKILAAVIIMAGSIAAKTTDFSVARALSSKTPTRLAPAEPRKAGRWHMAENGHAVFCYGPVVIMNVFRAGSEPKRYATECRGESKMVPLHD